MMWLSWRLHRAAVFTFVGVIGGLAALYLVDSVRLHDLYTASGLDLCIGVLNDTSCATARSFLPTVSACCSTPTSCCSS
jgi:hypothetical protein